jgi:hypothetical protein
VKKRAIIGLGSLCFVVVFAVMVLALGGSSVEFGEEKEEFFQPTLIADTLFLKSSTVIKANDSVSIPLNHTQNEKTVFDFSYSEKVSYDCNTGDLKRGEKLTAKILDSNNNTVRMLDRAFFHIGCPIYPPMEKLEKRVVFPYRAVLETDKNGAYTVIIENPQDKEIEISFAIGRPDEYFK